ncbi:MAG: transglutaminase domain-containing protein [Clostridia bacterium]|nr:transglutaminase domain-containing protein [Clostridia bacterium]
MSINIKDYTGDCISAVIKDEKRRNCFIANKNSMKANYLETVDAALLDNQILMCEETYPYLYAKPNPTSYQTGSRPELESYVADICQNCNSDFEKVIAIIDNEKMLFEKCRGHILFYGGTEEELLHKGEQLCECLARLTVALCEIIGIPARIITHCLGGHVTNEVYTDGKWWYVDPRCGLFFVGKDGKPASLKELCEDSSIVDMQTDEVKAHTSPRFNWNERADALKKYILSEYEVNTVKYYSLSDYKHYSYRWILDHELINMNKFSSEYSIARGAIDNTFLVRGEPQAEFSFTEEQHFSGKVMINVYFNNYVIAPRKVTFMSDNKEVYTTPDIVPVEFIHHPNSNIFTLGGDGHLFDTATLKNGIHVLTVQCEYAEGMMHANRRNFWTEN